MIEKVYVLLEMDYDWHQIIGVYTTKGKAEEERLIREEKQKNFSSFMKSGFCIEEAEFID